MTSKTKPKTKDGCEDCEKLILTPLAVHSRECHTDFKMIMMMKDGSTLDHIFRATVDGFLCAFTCKKYFTSRSSILRHIKTDQNCEIPEFKSINSSRLDENPVFPELKDITNAPRTLSGYDEAVHSACPSPKHRQAAEERTLGIIKSLDLVPFGIHNEDEGEETGFTNIENLDNMIEKFHGKITYISRKRHEVECVEEDCSKTTKKIKHISNHQGFSSTVLNGPYAKKLKNREYFEMNDDISELLNTCWISTPQIKYFAAKMMAGAVLYKPQTCEALLITTVEIYGRTACIDPHYERSDLSFPSSNTKYPHVWPVTSKTADGNKLLIGTDQCNYLITGSIRVDSLQQPEVGPSTNKFVLDSEELSRSMCIFLDQKVYEQARLLGEDVDCDGVDLSHSLYQLRQIRSKFNEIESYNRLRATFDLCNIFNHEPVSIFTLCNHSKAIASDNDEEPANYTLGSLLFMKIASEVISKKHKARLCKDIVESIMLKFKSPNQKIPKLIQEILNLYEQDCEEIRILCNYTLNRKLVALADMLASQLTKANKNIVDNIKTYMTKR